MQRLQFAGGDLWFALVNPLFEAPTAEMRAALPQQVSMAAEIHNAAMGGTLVSRVLRCQGVSIDQLRPQRPVSREFRFQGFRVE